MLIQQGLKWVALAAAGAALSGCVVGQPGAYGPVAYDDGFDQSQGVYSEAGYYDEPYYGDPYYVDNTPYYAPVYPVGGTSISYNYYDGGDRFSRQ